MDEDVNVDLIMDEIGGRRGSAFIKSNDIELIDGTNNNKNNLKNPEEEEKANCTLFSFDLNGWFCIINIIMGALGTGAFSYPSIVYTIGVFNSVICFIFISISIYFTLDLLRRFVVDTKLYSYGAITQETLGYFWLVAYAISSFIVYMMSISSYLKILYNTTRAVIPGIEDNNVAKFFYYFITYLIEVVLCMFTSNLSKISYLSLIAFCIFLIVLIRTIIESIINMSTENEGFDYITAFTIKDGDDSWEKFLSLISKINDFTFGFIGHSTFPTLLNTYKNSTDDEKTRKINKTHLIILCTIYGLFTLFGLFCLNKNYPQNLFLNKETLENFWEYLFYILIMIYLITLVPIRFIIIRDNYLSVMKKDFLPGKYEILMTASCLLINNLITCFLSDGIIKTTFNQIFSGILGVFMCFILPVINYVKIKGKTKIRSIIGYIVAIIFLLIGIFSIIFSIKNQTWNED